MDRVDYDALIELVRGAQQSSDLSDQRTLLQQFMAQSLDFLARHPRQMRLWELRAATALTLGDPLAGYEAGQRLLAAGAGDSGDANLLRVLAQLKNKGWLDKDEAEKHARYDWLLGTWSQSWSIAWAPRMINLANHAAVRQSGNFENITFIVNGSAVAGYIIADSGQKLFPMRGTVLGSGEISWERWYSPAGSWLPFHIISWNGHAKPGQTFYPSDWQPVISAQISADRRTMTMVVPSQDTSPTSANPMRDTITIQFTKLDGGDAPPSVGGGNANAPPETRRER
jgi:hypothetical protein